MAKQESIFKLIGTIGGVTFYKTKDGYFAKAKSVINAERVKTDPRFVRTLENAAEFKLAAEAGKFLRDAIRMLMVSASDAKVTPRVTQLMTKLIKEDISNDRGSRMSGNGIATPNGKALVKYFNFNNASILDSILLKPYKVNIVTGEISITSLDPRTDISVPEGATHFSLSGAMLIIDLNNRIYDLKLTNVVNNDITTPLSVILAPSSLPSGMGAKLFLLKMEYFQMVSTEQYPLKNGKFNSLAIIEVG